MRTAFDRDTVPPALGRFVIQRTVTAAVPLRRHRDEVVTSGAVPLLPRLDALGLSSHPEIAALVRTVLLHAAASSPAALLATLRRYRHLLLQARDALAAGVPPDRRSLRRITGTSPEQLVMWSLLPPLGEEGELLLADLPGVENLIAETRRVADQPDPKSSRLTAILADDVPTLVYVTARETITYLRRHLPDRWLAWCSGERAGVGRTVMPRGDVLSWFRPDAPRHPPTLPGRPRTLLTTDVTAEGLDLQGAGRVVHYDLPWTEVRLAQRDGRAARRGSARTHVDIIRFLPDHEIEGRLRQLQSLTRKSGLPSRYGLGSTGRLMWRWRGDLADELAGPQVEGLSAVQSSRAGTVAGVVLERDTHPVVSAVLVRNGEMEWAADAREIRERLHEAAHGAPVPPPQGEELQTILSALAPSVRALLREASLGRVAGLPSRPATLALGKRLRRMAETAARRRDASQLALLERGLRFCTRGHTAGESMLIESLAGRSDAELLAGLKQTPSCPAPLSPLRPRLTGLIVFRPT